MVTTKYPKNSLAEKLEYLVDPCGDYSLYTELTELAESAHLLESQLALKIHQLSEERKLSEYWWDKFLGVSQVYTKFTEGMNGVLNPEKETEYTETPEEFDGHVKPSQSEGE